MVDVFQYGVAQQLLQVVFDGVAHFGRGGCPLVEQEGVVGYGGLAQWYVEHEGVVGGLAQGMVDRGHGAVVDGRGGRQGIGEEARLVDHQHGGGLGGAVGCHDGQGVEGGQQQRHQQGQHPERGAAEAHAALARYDEQ